MISALTDGKASEGGPASDSLTHVLLVVDELSRTLGGGERIVLKIAESLPRYGYRASILTFFADPESAALLYAPCPVYLLPLRKTYDVAAVRSAQELRAFIRRERVAIVQTFFESSDLWAGLVAKTTSARLIWSRRDMGILRARKHEILYRWMAGLPDAVFAVSEQVRGHVIKVDGVKPARVHTIYNGLDLKGWKPRHEVTGMGVKRILVTTVGNIRRVKGHDIFVKAAAQLASRFPEASFSVAGEVLDEDYFAELLRLVRGLNLEGRFHFAGGVSDPASHLSQAEVFVLPSRSEGFSNAIIEAMAASLPVVATDVGGNAEAVKNGVSGYIVPPDDVDALAAAIASMLDDPAKARQMGAAGRKLVERQFTVDAMMSSIVDSYHSVLRGDSR